MENMEVRILELKEKAIGDNDEDARLLREQLRREHAAYANVMSSPGSGKTTLIRETVRRLQDSFRFGVMEADIDSDVDARMLQDCGIPAVQLHTGGMCHLSADMSRQGLALLRKLGKFDCVILENVGNLVCPAEFDTGAHWNIVILSVPEGDDKPLKYPLMFQKADVVLLNKIDALEAFDYDMDAVMRRIRQRKEGIPVFPVSGETGEGMDAWCEYFAKWIRKFQEESHERYPDH